MSIGKCFLSSTPYGVISKCLDIRPVDENGVTASTV